MGYNRTNDIKNNRGVETPRGGGIIYTDPSQRVSPFMDPIRRYRLASLLKWLFLLGILLIIAWIPSIHWEDWHTYHTRYNELGKVKDHPGDPEGKYQRPYDQKWIPATTNLPSSSYDKADNILTAEQMEQKYHQKYMLSDKFEEYTTKEREYFGPLQICTVVFCLVIVTCQTRLLLPRGWFGKWNDAAQAFRDWIFAGILCGALYYVYLYFVSGRIPGSPPPRLEIDHWMWFRWRAVYGLMPCGLITFGIFRLLRRKEPVGRVPLIAQWIVEAIMLGLAFRPILDSLSKLSQNKQLSITSLVLGLLCCLTVMVALLIAYLKDRKVAQLRQHGVRSGSAASDMTITIIGGRSAGKTTFLAGAFHQWTMEKAYMGPFRIDPLYSAAGDQDAGASGKPVVGQDYDIATIARNLYQNRQLPAGNVTCQDLPFELRFDHVDPSKQARVGTFSVLDYPGGSIVGVASNDAINTFKEHLHKTDGLLLVADMSRARRGVFDKDYQDVLKAYMDIMDFVLKCNGRNRVVPVALILTKCDEFYDDNDGGLNLEELDTYLGDYADILRYWEKRSKEYGPGFIQWSQWYTSALTYTRPADNDPAKNQPFVLSDAPPKPTNCAAPLLWLCREIMYWNVTLATDLATFVFGSSPAYRRQVDAIEALEPVIQNLR